MLYIVGLGLSWKDLSVRGFETIQKSEKVYVEGYTSLADYSVAELEKLTGKKIKVLHRESVEVEQTYLQEAKTKDVTLLIYGDPLSATTHFELLQDAKKLDVKTEVIHSSAVLTAVADTGLSLYKFGKTASIPFEREGFTPKSFFTILKENNSIGAHTLFLLDLDPKSDNFLTVSEAIERLQKIAKQEGSDLISLKTKFIGCARLGASSQTIKVGNSSELMKFDFGRPPYCLILPGKLNFKEEEYLDGG